MECKGRPKWRDAPLTMKAPYKRNAKYPVARDVGKPLGGFRRHQGQNRSRHFASDQPINRFRVSLVKLDFNGSSGSYRGPNRRARSGLLVLYRDLLARKIGHQFDLWTRYHKGNQVVRVVCRHGRRRLSIAGREGFGTTRCFGIARFLPRRGGRTCSRHVLRERCSGRDLLLYRSATGIGGGHGRRSRDLCRRRIGLGGGATRGFQSCLYRTRRERDAKNLEACDFGKPLGRFRIHRSQNRSRYFSTDQPIDRPRLTVAQLDFSCPRCRDRGPDTIVRRRLSVIYRNLFVGQIGYRLDFWASHEKRNQIVGVIWRRGCGFFGIAQRHGLRAVGTAGITRFLFRHLSYRGGRHALRERRRCRYLLLYRSGTGTGGGTDLVWQYIGLGSGVVYGLQRRDLGSRHFAGNWYEDLICYAGVRRGLQPTSSYPCRVVNYCVRRALRELRGCRVSRHGRRLTGPGHIGLAGAVTRQAVDIYDVRRIQRMGL